MKEQGSLKSVRGFLEQIFVLKQLVKKRKRTELYVGFMDLGSAHDKVCREEPWRILYEYGVIEYLATGVKSLHGGYRACMRRFRGLD